ncbi:Ras protein Rab 18 [Trichuris trichiura]|uniref:Ras protein Rab 18 n=1 Tax=Trichuris trichiura TaxID=36087 RepID=A0A077YW53_TRITR|nr:Ras protein Rab 18 [Trichuris trichiura]
MQHCSTLFKLKMDDSDSAVLTSLKILLIGDSGVGKSCLFLRFVDDVFSEDLPATIGMDYKTKCIYVEGNCVRLRIWDTAGMERFRTMTDSFYRNAQGIIFVYDITKRQSFLNIVTWLDEVNTYCNKQNAVKILVGNKIDQQEYREVKTAEGIRCAQDNSLLFIETSAKTSENVRVAFEELVLKILETPELWESDENYLKLQTLNAPPPSRCYSC